MKVNEFFNMYELHDNLLEELTYSDNELILTIELGDWMNIVNTSDDTRINIMKLVFRNVSDYMLDAACDDINSDIILDVFCVKDNDNPDIEKVKFIIEGISDTKIIEFKCSNLDIHFE